MSNSWRTQLQRLLMRCSHVASVVGLCGILMGCPGCGATGSYVWVNEAPDEFFRPESETLIAIGDLMSVRVFGQEPLSAHERVRTDGAYSLPLVGDISVAGQTPTAIGKLVEQKLRPFVNDPHVTVVVEEARRRVTILGEARHNGNIDLDGAQGLFEALALSGGLTEFASESRIFVLRSTPRGTIRIRFNYGEICRGEGRAAAFRLRTGDKIAVE